ncbi:MAG: hypothetical protein NW224_28830 [Leptolyngbyaceae cyanobacterium bins.302]|nr:hypothetical protein [Leptolyngbyaceae cyanobacterium bins.302]
MMQLDNDGVFVALSDLAAQVKTIADMIIYVWFFALAIALLMGKHFNQFGFTFRTLPGLWMPPTSESINRTSYVFDNAETLLLLGGLLLLRGTRDLFIVSVVAVLVDCLNGLLFPKTAIAFNSNNILFSYLGFLLLRGYFEPGIIAVLVTILVGCVCTRMLWGMVPSPGEDSWKTHLISFGGGVLLARFLDTIAAFLPISKLW